MLANLLLLQTPDRRNRSDEEDGIVEVGFSMNFKIEGYLYFDFPTIIEV